MRLQSLFPALAALGAAVVAQDTTTAYTDPSTGITFQSISPVPSFRMGFALPPTASADLILQIVAPLSAASPGWGGVVLGPSMSGFLQLVAWPAGGGRVTIAPRLSSGYNVLDTRPYTAAPITVAPIGAGTFLNATHLSATFVCGGCANADSFDPATPDPDQMFAFAYSRTAVVDPGNAGTLLSNHNGGDGDSGRFSVDVKAAKSDRFGEWVKMAGAQQSGGSDDDDDDDDDDDTAEPTPTLAGGSQPQRTGGSTAAPHGAASEAEGMPYNKMTPGAMAALALAGLLYVLGAVNAY